MPTGSTPESQWCLIGNIAEEPPSGPGGEDVKIGTKHFSPGTKVYCFPAEWGDGYDQIRVVARHRGSKRYVTMIISSSWVTNWRAKVVYSPEVIRRLEEGGTRKWESEQEVREYVQMNNDFSNVYDDAARAGAYAGLEFPGTYYLACRDLPAIIGECVSGGCALDFGCGTGRSTRFLLGLGFDSVSGVDIAEHMVALARERDPTGEYLVVPDGNLSQLTPNSFDLVLAAFTFDNIPTMEKKVALFESLKHLLKDGGRIVSLVSSPDTYLNEWTSFSTKGFPENREAKSGDMVRIVMLDVDDKRPIEDIVWTDEAYHEVYERAGLTPINTYRPLGKEAEPFAWVSETRIAPWVIYVLERAG